MIPKRGGGFVVKNGRPIVAARDMNEKSKEWIGQVRDAAHAVYSGDLLQGPVRLTCMFYFSRPKSHLRSGKRSGELKDSAPEHHCSTPDLAKLFRCLEDALTGVVWQDDRQVCYYGSFSGKFWTTSAEMAIVSIEELVLLRRTR